MRRGDTAKLSGITTDPLAIQWFPYLTAIRKAVLSSGRYYTSCPGNVDLEPFLLVWVPHRGCNGWRQRQLLSYHQAAAVQRHSRPAVAFSCLLFMLIRDRAASKSGMVVDGGIYLSRISSKIPAGLYFWKSRGRSAMCQFCLCSSEPTTLCFTRRGAIAARIMKNASTCLGLCYFGLPHPALIHSSERCRPSSPLLEFCKLQQ